MDKGIHIIYEQEASECEGCCDHCPWHVVMGKNDIRSEEDVRQAGIEHVQESGHQVHIYRGNYISIQKDEEE